MCIRSSVEWLLNKLLAVAASVSMAVVWGAGAAHATPVYFTGTTGTATFQGGRVVGSIFTASTTQTFNSVGFIDVNASGNPNAGPDGLVSGYQVGIWLVSTQTLLASAWVTPTSPLGAFENFRYTQIPTVTIPAGQQFVVAALLPASPLDAWLVNDSHTNSVGIVGAGSGRFEIGGTIVYPTQIGGAVYSVANASSAIPVPEPTAATLLSLSLGGLGVFGRYRRRR
jgi:hypothetical protein